MATDTAVPPVRRPFRPFFPLSVLLVAALSIVGLQNLPADWRAFWPTIASWIVIMLSGLLIACWWFLYSGLSWAVRLAIPLGLLGALVGTVQVERVHFYTDMVPDYYFRWQTPPRPPQQDVLGPVALPESKPTDAPAYRGRNRDGIVVGPALARDWKTQPPREIWREGVGTGLGGIAVVGTLAITLEQRDNEEAVAAYNTENGKLQWIRRYPARFNEQMGGPGPRTTPTVVGDRVVTLGAQGDLLCLKITDGSIL
jgi:outer membrane protein assembly factor BamB